MRLRWRGLRRLRNSSGDENGSDPMKYWEIIADNLSASGWSWGCSSHVDSTGRLLFTADAHRHNGKRFIVSVDDALALRNHENNHTRNCTHVFYCRTSNG